MRRKQTTRAEQEQRLARVVREKWDPNGVEYLAGAISSLITDAQLEALIKAINSR